MIKIHILKGGFAIKINFIRYIIQTKDNPIEFIESSGNCTSNIEEALLFCEEENTKFYLKDTFDEPDKFKVVPLEITYEF